MALSPTEIQNAYVAFFNRPADVAGLTYWGSYAGSAGDLLNTFAQSAEYNALYKGMNNTQLVNAIYQNLFGRSPDVDGLNYWVNQLDSGKVTIGNAANTIQKGAQGTDKSIIENKVLAATAFTTALDTTAEIVGYAGASSATLGQVKAWLSTVTDTSTSLEAAKTGLTALTGSLAGGTNEAPKEYVLTTAQDTFTGTNGNDNFRAVAGKTDGQQDQTTLNSSDIIDGGTGADALIVNMTGTLYQGGARIKNIETLKIGTNLTAAATFDYNVNAGFNEISEVTNIVADQINVNERLNVTNILKTGSAIPTLTWDNEAGSVAGAFSTTFRESAVSGDTEVKLVLDDVNNGGFVLGNGMTDASVETLRVVSQGTTTNTLDVIGGGTDGAVSVDLISISADGVDNNSALKKVIVEGAQTFGKVATVVTDTTKNASFGLVNRVDYGATDVGLTDAAALSSASNLTSLSATVTELDASAATGDTNIRFTSKIDATEVNVTYKGGKGNDYVEFQQGNINATGGDGNDTFAFVNAQFNSTLTTADTIVGGAGTDTIQMGVNGLGNYNLDTTEFNNKSGIDVLDLRGATNTVRLADAFVGAADAGLTVRTDKIVQTSDTDTGNSGTYTGTAFRENNSVNTITMTSLAANRKIDFKGGSGSDRIVVNEVSLNSNVSLDGGTNASTNVAKFDTITVQDSAVLSRGDLANVKGFEGIVLVKSDNASARQYTIEVTEAFLSNNSSENKTLQVGTTAAANQNALSVGDTVTIDVSDLLNASNTGLKTTTYDKKIDTSSLTAAGATVRFVGNGGATVDSSVLQGASMNSLLRSSADSSQSAVLASAAQAVSNAGNNNNIASPLIGSTDRGTLTATSNVVGTTASENWNATVAAAAGATVNGGTGTDSITLTDSGSVAVSSITNVETLVLNAGGNTVTFAGGGAFTNVIGGAGADDVAYNNMVTGGSVDLGAGNDTLQLNGATTQPGYATLTGGAGDDVVVLGGATNISMATLSGFEQLQLGTNTVTMTTAQFSGFASGITATTGQVTFSNAGSVTVGLLQAPTTYNLAADGNTLTVTTSTAVNVVGGAGVDNITGGSGGDTLAGGAGADVINGGAGNDTITGGAGADQLTGGTGNDTFVFATRADTRAAGFAAGDTTTANIDKITDFVGNGAAAGDVIQLGTGANVFGAAITFTGATTATVTAVTVATAADFTALAAAVQAASAGVASTAAVAQAYDVTVTAGNLAGRYLIVNDDTAGIAATDTIVALTGVTGALNANDFAFV